MPLQTFPASTALGNLKSRSAIWPSRGKGNRKGSLPLPEVKPTFQIADTDRVFCLGSCFAINIGYVLQHYGFDVVTTQSNPHLVGDWGRSNHLTRYNVFSMLNDFRLALEPGATFNEDCWVQEPGGLWMDPYGHYQFQPHSRDVLRTLREFTTTVIRQLPSCRVVVVTLGLVEAWFDAKTGDYTNIQPSKHALQLEPDRFTLHVLDYADVLRGIEAIHTLLTRHGHPDFRMLVTTSPVPLHASFTGQDVFTANAYSKSVQRAALAEFVSRHTNVDYFPSYESITLGNPDLVWKEDQRHVTELAIAANMESVLRAYAPQKQGATPSIDQLRQIDTQLDGLRGQLTWNKLVGLMATAKQQETEIQRLQAEIAQLKLASPRAA